MGENLELEGRLAVRTTMQWDETSDGGFGPPGAKPCRRRPPSGGYGPAHVNVASQLADPDSMLNWMVGAIRLRRLIPEVGDGSWRVPDVEEPAVLAHCCELDGSHFVAVHNLAGGARAVQVAVEAPDDLHAVLESPGTEIRAGEGCLEVSLPRYGHVWLQTKNPLQGHTAGLSRT